MATENITMDTYKNSLLEGEETEEFVSEEDPSDYKQYKTSRRRQLIFKIAIVGFVGTLLVITIVYFTKLRHKEDGALKACKDGEKKFQELPGKCFSVRLNVQDESVTYVNSDAACTRECLSLPWCVSVDFFHFDGECYTYSVRSADVPDDGFVDTRSARHGLEEAEAHRLKSCTHYDRVCL